MITQTFALWASQATAFVLALRRLPLERKLAYILAATAGVYLSHLMIFDPLISQLPADQIQPVLSRTGTALAVGVSSFAFAHTVAFPGRLQDHAHRVSASTVAVWRAVESGAAGLAASWVLIITMGWGAPVTPPGWITVLMVEIPAGLVVGVAVAMAAELMTRSITQRQALPSATRVVSLTATIASVTAVLLFPDILAEITVTGLVVMVTVTLTGLPPLRVAWLQPPRHRPSTRASRGRTDPRWLGLALSRRDLLAAPTALVMAVLIGLSGLLARFSWGESIADLYLAARPLLLAEVIGAAAITAVTKQTPGGSGLYGHRWRPAHVAAWSQVTAYISATAIGVVTLAVAALTTGVAPTLEDVVTIIALSVVASAAGVVLGAIRRAPADAAETPMPLALLYMTCVGLVGSILASLPVGLLLASIPVAAVTVWLIVVRTLHLREPFTS